MFEVFQGDILRAPIEVHAYINDGAPAVFKCLCLPSIPEGIVIYCATAIIILGVSEHAAAVILFLPVYSYW